MSDRRRGTNTYTRLIGTDPERALAGLRARSPQLAEWMLEGAFAGPLSRPDLSMAHRELATVVILAAQGDSAGKLAMHAKAALLHGWTPSELRAVCEHVSVYAGFPRGLNALEIVDQVLTEAGCPPAPALRTVELSDHDTVLAQLGQNGPPVLLVHALGLDWRMWEPVLAGLAVGRRVIAYDVRGHGVAAGAPTPNDMETLAADLFAVMDAAGLESAHLIGLSYGGGIVQTAALSAPERFDSMTLMATTNRPFDAFEARARSIETDGMAAQVAPSLVRWFTPDALAANGWGVRYARDSVLRGNPADVAGAWRAFTTLDVVGKFGAFTAPTLVVAGQCDASTTPEVMTAIADDIPGARYLELPGTPHMPTLERPELALEALDGFLPRG